MPIRSDNNANGVWRPSLILFVGEAQNPGAVPDPTHMRPPNAVRPQAASSRMAAPGNRATDWNEDKVGRVLFPLTKGAGNVVSGGERRGRHPLARAARTAPPAISRAATIRTGVGCAMPASIRAVVDSSGAA